MKNAIVWSVMLLFLSTCAVGQKSKSKKNTGVDQVENPLTNEIIWYSRTFIPKDVSGIRSMNSGEQFTTLEVDYRTGNTAIKKWSYADYSELETIVSSKDLMVKKEGKETPLSIEDYTFSADESKLLIATNVSPIYRHSTEAYYYIYELKTKKLYPLSDYELGKQRLAEFSPKKNRVAFVRGNNLFIKDFDTNEETQVTSDGKMNEVINGATDWVYEEEFSFDKGFQWAPGGDKLAYLKFDESEVKQFQMAMYGSLYPYQYTFKYPKAGEDNSIVAVEVYEINSKRTTVFDTGSEADIYLPRIKWANDGYTLMVTRLNRLQNQLDLLVGEFKGGRPNNRGVQTRVVYSEKAETYIDITDNLTFLKDNETFLWTSEKDGYNHLYQINLKNGEEKQITNGKWEVTELLGINENTNTIYYISAESSPMERDLYSIQLDGSKKTKISTRKGQNEVDFSKGMKYFINTHSSANTPDVFSLHKANGKEIKVLEDNAHILENMKKYGFTKKEFLTVTTEDNIDLNAWMIKPPGFDAKKKYPLLMFVYGGPGINTVHDAWGGHNFLWFQMMAQKGYVVVSVDARGTGYRGRDFKHCTYLQLGKYETIDQIAAAKKLGEMPYIDADRIGIFGWSYGGYMSSLCITKGADVFKAAIAVAPVTNWRYYDNVYTERFMRTPQENGENYDSNSPINHVSKLKGNYLLVHGSADDNVHYQNTMEMIDALVNHNKQFDLFIYPNKNHGIYGGPTRLHLFTKMTNFLLENL